MEQIMKRKKFSLIEYFKHKNFVNTLYNGSPSFGTLWQMADFVKTAEIVYFYDNNSNMPIYSSNGYLPGQNGLKFEVEDATIIYKLYSDDQRVVLHIQRKKGNKITDEFTFEGDQWTTEFTEFDDLLVDYVIQNTMTIFIEFFEHYYKNKFVRKQLIKQPFTK
jgi:hypothetical protein